MIISLGIDVSFAVKNIDFVFKSLKGSRKKVLYFPTLKKIYESGATHLVIPYDVKGYDYNYKTLIEHIRADYNQAIALIPIMVL